MNNRDSPTGRPYRYQIGYTTNETNADTKREKKAPRQVFLSLVKVAIMKYTFSDLHNRCVQDSL